MTIPTPAAVKPRPLAPARKCANMAIAQASTASDSDLRKVMEAGRAAGAAADDIAAAQVAFDRLAARAKSKVSA